MPQSDLPAPVIYVDDAITIDSDDDNHYVDIVDHGLDLQQHRREREARTRNRNQNVARRRVPIAVRNAPIQRPFSEISSYECNGTALRAGKTVELRDGTFLHLKAVIHNPYDLNDDDGTHVVLFRGWLLKRCTNMNGLFEKRRNELCYVYEVDADDPRQIQEQSVLEVSLADVLKVRQLVRTNRPFPQYRYSLHDLPEVPQDQYIRDEERLVVRWKLTTIFPHAQERVAFQKEQHYLLPIIRKIESLTERECTRGYYALPEASRHAWRGNTIPGGSGQKHEHNDLEPEPEPEPVACPKCEEEFMNAVKLVEHYEAAHSNEKQRATIVLTDVEAHMSPRIRQSREFENIPKEKRCYTFGDGCKFLYSLRSSGLMKLIL